MLKPFFSRWHSLACKLRKAKIRDIIDRDGKDAKASSFLTGTR
jgi:hypothetical protein